MRTPECTLGKSDCAISGIMVWIYVGGLYWERLCRYRRDTTRCGIYIIQCHPLNMLQSSFAVFGQLPILA